MKGDKPEVEEVKNKSRTEANVGGDSADGTWRTKSRKLDDARGYRPPACDDEILGLDIPPEDRRVAAGGHGHTHLGKNTSEDPETGVREELRWVE